MKERSNINDESDAIGQTPASSTSGIRSFSRIFQEILNHLTEILRCEVRLARTELRQKVTQVAKASVFVGIGAVFAMYALGFLLLGVVDMIATKMAFWLSAVSVGSGLAVLAAIFYQVGRTRLQQAMQEPSTTIQSVQENLTWMKERTK
jgi:uncharacterized membrane protein YqjE